MGPQSSGDDTAANSSTPANLPLSTEKLLRPPPFSKRAFSTGLRPNHAAGARSIQKTPPSLQQRPSMSFFPPEGDLQTETTRSTAPSARAEGSLDKCFLRPATVDTITARMNENHQSEEGPTHRTSPLFQNHASAAQAGSPFCASRAVSCIGVEQRQFEAEIMSQVEAVLQAQRSESYAELEAYRVAAEEAQTTLRAVENALAQQIGGITTTAAAHFSSPAPGFLSSGGGNGARSVPTTPPDLDQLAVDMSRVAAAATSSATQRLLDAIMAIQDGEDVPSVLLEVVHELYDELTRMLVPPVMNFIQTLQQPPPSKTPSHPRLFSATVAGAASPQEESLSQAHAEAAALREEVVMLRQTLESRCAGGYSIAAGAASSCLTGPPLPSSDTVRRALLDRFFTECHSMLTRNRQESLALRRALEEERRQHFLTRIRLLKPAPPSLSVPSPAREPADGNTYVVTAAAPAVMSREEGGITSPVVRSTTASQDRRAASADRPAVTPLTIDSRNHRLSPAARKVDAQTSPPRWSPARAVLQFTAGAKGSEGDAELHDGRGSGGSREVDEAKSPAMSSTREASRTARTFVSPEEPPPPLHSALHVAKEVLRTTSTSSATHGVREHPCDSYSHCRDDNSNSDNDGMLRARTALVERASWNTTAQRRELPRRLSGPSVSFSESTVDDSAFNSSAFLSRNFGDSVASQAPFHRGDNARATVGGRQGDEHEKRVWNKAVELLSRYSIP
jgi:hypothetical protein